jgi:endoglucanase
LTRLRSLALASALVLVACGSSAGDAPPLPDAPPGPDRADASAPPPAPPPAPLPRNVIGVAGARLIDGDGRTVNVHGVNYSGAEYMCIQGRGIFDGPVDDALVDAMVAWNVNVVRVPLNPHCWLGLDGVDARYAGQPYRDAIVGFVDRLRARGLYVVLEAHWSSSIAGQATKQQPMIDREYGLPFWSSAAATFASDRGVMFDPYNEPYLSIANTNHAFADDVWECWRLGCDVQGTGESFVAAGMQPLVDAIRDTGARNVILLGGLDYANDVRGLVSHLPVDPAFALAASTHVYDFNRCNDETCWTAEIAEVAKSLPVVALELGQTDCAEDFVDRYMAWADAAGVGYAGWTFNVGDCAKRPSLLADWDGTPSALGAGFKAHFATLPK